MTLCSTSTSPVPVRMIPIPVSTPKSSEAIRTSMTEFQLTSPDESRSEIPNRFGTRGTDPPNSMALPSTATPSTLTASAPADHGRIPVTDGGLDYVPLDHDVRAESGPDSDGTLRDDVVPD